MDSLSGDEMDDAFLSDEDRFDDSDFEPDPSNNSDFGDFVEMPGRGGKVPN